MSSSKVYLYAFISMTFWALSFVWYKEAFLSYGPVTVVFFRMVISVSILFLILLFTGKKILPAKSDFKWLFLISFFEPFCYFMGEGYGMLYVSPTTGAIIISTVPLLTPVFLLFFGIKEKISFANFFGIVVSFIGIIFVVTSDGTSLSASGKGVTLLFVAVVSAILFSIVLKKIGAKYNSIVIVFWQNLMAIFMFLPFFIALELNSFINSTHEAVSYTAILKLGAFPSTISFVLFIPVVTYLGAAKANTFTNLIPVVTAIFSFLFFGEEFGITKVIGIFAVITGLFISQIKITNKKIEGVPVYE